MLVPNVPFILSNKNRDKLLCCWFSLCAGTESSARFCSGLFCGLAGAIWRRQGELGGTLWPNKAELARIAQESCLCSRHKAQSTQIQVIWPKFRPFGTVNQAVQLIIIRIKSTPPATSTLSYLANVHCLSLVIAIGSWFSMMRWLCCVTLSERADICLRVRPYETNLSWATFACVKWQ